MSEQAKREALLLQLDTDLLRGGVVLSEWCARLVRESDIAFVAGAYLAALLTAMAAIETFLRSEALSRKRLMDLVAESELDRALVSTLHELRIYRNKWVHVDDPWDDESLLQRPGEIDRELESRAFAAVKALRQVVYSDPWI